MEFVEKHESGCWLWTGAHSGFGYGVLRINHRNVFTHRISWELHIGPIKKGQHVLHKCDVPACVNPEHLFLGTLQDNSVDMMQKLRHPNLKFTPEQIRAIRADPRVARIVALEYGVHFGTIHAIRQRRTWQWIP